MVKIKSAAECAANYNASLGTVPAKYKAGVAATSDWAEKAKSDEAEQLYAAKTQEAISNRSRQAGLADVSNGQWQNASTTVGFQRIAGGMAAGSEKRTKNFEPYRQAIAGLTLQPRSADGRANVGRVGQVVDVMLKTKGK